MRENTSVLSKNYFESTGLQYMEKEEEKLLALKNAIQEGLNSEVVTDFDSEKHLKSIKAKRING